MMTTAIESTAPSWTDRLLVSGFVALALVTLGITAHADRQSFVAGWQGRTVILKQPLYSITCSTGGIGGPGRETIPVTILTDGRGPSYAGHCGGRDAKNADVHRLTEQFTALTHDLVAFNETETPDGARVRKAFDGSPAQLSEFAVGATMRVTKVTVAKGIGVDNRRVVFWLSSDGAEPPAATALVIEMANPISSDLREQARIDELASQYFATP